jgi:hypothetical protein
MSQGAIEEELMRMSGILEDETDAFGVLAEDHAKKEARFKAEWAKTFLSSDGTVKDRESQADYQNASEIYDLKIADALMRAKREKLVSTRESMGALRTLAANVRNQT